MPADWVPIPLNTKLFQNVQETALTRAFAAVENCFPTEADGISRFPGLAEFATLPNDFSRVYLHDYRNDLMATTAAGRTFRIDKQGRVEDRTGVTITGGMRHTFAKTDSGMLVAAGAQIVEFNGETTKILSEEAPLASHVAVVDNFVLANEVASGRFYHSGAGAYNKWDPLDTFAASGSPDEISALIVTPFREVLVAGPNSIEQFERLPSGDPPFFRRWSVGEGLFAPYTFCFEDNTAWGISEKFELARYSGQTQQSTSDDIGRTLDAIEDWEDAWAQPLQVLGQKFILLQVPNAVNPYGSKGLTFLYDYRQQKWSTLYGWDAEKNLPARWPGWSVYKLWGRVFVGGEGKIYELTPNTYYQGGNLSRMLFRTAHFSELGEMRIDQLRMRFRRGLGTYTSKSKISVRANRDNKGFGSWVRRDFGLRGEREMVIHFGNFGCAHTWQFEVQITDDVPVEIVKMEAQITRLGY